MLKKWSCIILLAVLANAVSGSNDSLKRVVTPHVNVALRFTENSGQWDDRILFKSRLQGGVLFVERNCLTFNFYDSRKLRELHLAGLQKKKPNDYNIRGHAYRMHFEGCEPQPQIEKLQMNADHENYFIGADQRKWKSNVRNYQHIWLRNLYKGIDYEAITSAKGIKYNFHVQAGADPSVIKLRYEGAGSVSLSDGKLVVKLSVTEVVEQKPYAYQLINGEVREVPCHYRLKGNVLSFELPQAYDKNHELVIDPVLVFSAQAGATADNFGMTATFDAQGNLYSGGIVFDTGYPYVMGSYSNVFNGPAAYGNTDVFITKYNAAGNALLYSTYLGGDRTEVVSSLIVNKADNSLCLYGATSSTNFPVTGGAYDPTFNGGSNIGFLSNGTVFYNGSDIFVTRFSPSGNALIGSTFFGGSGNDGINYLGVTSPVSFPLAPAPGFSVTNTTNYDSLQTNYGDQFRGEIQLDTLGNIYVISSTRSPNLPIVNGFDGTLGGIQDAVVFKMNPTLTSLLYSSYLGGSNIDCGNGLFVTPNFEVFATGGTTSNDFPGVAGGQTATYQGGRGDGFLSRISSAGNTLMQSTYIGTALYDNSFFVQCNAAGDPYVFGQSLGNMPVIPALGMPVYSVTNTHQFITRYNPQLTTKLMSTVFGGSTSNIDISPSAFAVDECNGNIYLSGWGGDIVTNVPFSGLPLANATQSTTTGFDFYLMALAPNASSLLYGSYYGGNQSAEHVDGGTSRFDRKGMIYQSVCAGCGQNQDFPITTGAWPCPNMTNCPTPNPSNNCNNGVFKIDFKLQDALATINQNTISGCPPVAVNFTNATPGTGFIWHFGNGQTNSVTLNPSFTYTNPGTYTVSLVVTDTMKCVKKDSAVTIITVFQRPTAAFSASYAPCNRTVTIVNNTSGSLSPNPYIWNLGDGSPTLNVNVPPLHTYTANGVYTINLSVTGVNGCTSAATQTVSVFDFTPTVNSGSICAGETLNLTAAGGTSYTWSPPAGLSATNVPSPQASPSVSTVYSVQVNNNSAGYTCSKTLTSQVMVHAKPAAAFTFTRNPCGGGVNFFDGSSANISTWNWTLSSGVTSTVQNPYYFYSAGGSHTVTLVVTNTAGCTDTSRQVIIVDIPPPMSVNGNSTICLGRSVQLSASGGTSYAWTPASSLDNANSQNPVATPSVSTQYTVDITAGNGCKFTLTTNVSVLVPPPTTAAAVANPTFVVTGNSTTLVYTGPSGYSVGWLPVGSTTPATGYTVSATPDKPTTYTAVVSSGPCTERATVFVEAYTEGCIDSDVFIPNTFTPNGDGNNDILYVRGLKVDEVYFAVYNRWGELVFETTDRTKGWDGMYRSRPADVGVFGWYLRVKCFNGEETFRKGNVTLIR